MARLEKTAPAAEARKKDELSSFKNEKKAGHGRLARLAGGFMLTSLLAFLPTFGGQHSGVDANNGKVAAKSAKSMFPTLERISSFKEPGKDTIYPKKVVKLMKDVDSFVQENSDNRAFMLVMEAIMHEALGVQAEKNVDYYIDYSSAEDKVTLTDSLKNWKKLITIRKGWDGVEISVETEGEPKLSIMLKKGENPKTEDIDELRLRLYNLFDDLFCTDLFLRAAAGD
jgi:hypothetical protein